jgi:YfiH family protein
MKSEPSIEFIRARWNAPPQVKALCTTRNGGFGEQPYDSFNLAAHVGDDDKCVQRNRELLRHTLDLPAEPCWLEQTHSTRVINLESESTRVADAANTQQAGTIAVVMTADCLPILLCNKAGTEVAAIHAGWRGLADGVIEAAVLAMQSPPDQLLAWIGPGISQQCFEVGDEVREIFIARNNTAEDHFIANRPAHWLCDLGALASDTLTRLKVAEINRAEYCSFKDESLFYSYRRNAPTGRMASLIWIDSST